MGRKFPEITTVNAEGLMKGCPSAEGSSGSWTPKPHTQLQQTSLCSWEQQQPYILSTPGQRDRAQLRSRAADPAQGMLLLGVGQGNTARVKWKIKKTFRLPKTFPPGGSPAPTSSPGHGRRCCPLRRPRFDPSLPWGRFSSGLCGTRSCKPAMQRRGSHCFSALIHTDSKRLGKGKKNALKILLTGWKMKAKWNTAQSVKTKSQQAHWKEKKPHSSARRQ